MSEFQETLLDVIEVQKTNTKSFKKLMSILTSILIFTIVTFISVGIVFFVAQKEANRVFKSANVAIQQQVEDIKLIKGELVKRDSLKRKDSLTLVAINNRTERLQRNQKVTDNKIKQIKPKVIINQQTPPEKKKKETFFERLF